VKETIKGCGGRGVVGDGKPVVITQWHQMGHAQYSAGQHDGHTHVQLDQILSSNRHRHTDWKTDSQKDW